MLVIATDHGIRPLASDNPHVGRVLDGVLINGPSKGGKPPIVRSLHPFICAR